MPTSDARWYKELLQEKNRIVGVAIGVASCAVGLAGLAWCYFYGTGRKDEILYPIILNVCCAILPVNIMSILYFLWTKSERVREREEVTKDAMLRHGVVAIHERRPDLGALMQSSQVIDIMTTNVSGILDDLAKLSSSTTRTRIRLLILNPRSEFAKYRYAEIGLNLPHTAVQDRLS